MRLVNAWTRYTGKGRNRRTLLLWVRNTGTARGPAGIDRAVTFRSLNPRSRRPDYSPAKPPEQVADSILRLIERPRREVSVGAPPWLPELGMAVAGALAPAVPIGLAAYYRYQRDGRLL